MVVSALGCTDGKGCERYQTRGQTSDALSVFSVKSASTSRLLVVARTPRVRRGTDNNHFEWSSDVMSADHDRVSESVTHESSFIDSIVTLSKREGEIRDEAIQIRLRVVERSRQRQDLRN